MIKRFLFLILSMILIMTGIWLNRLGFDRVERLRLIERIPRTDINTLVRGEANISGKVVSY